jgi:hypothetical protein
MSNGIYGLFQSSNPMSTSFPGSRIGHDVQQDARNASVFSVLRGGVDVEYSWADSGLDVDERWEEPREVARRECVWQEDSDCFNPSALDILANLTDVQNKVIRTGEMWRSIVHARVPPPISRLTGAEPQEQMWPAGI